MTTTSPQPTGDPPTEAINGATPPASRRRRGRTLVGGVLVLAVAAAAVIVIAKPWLGSGPSHTGVTDNATPTSLATVKEGTLSQQVNSSGTLGYIGQADGSPYSVVNQASGAFTELPNTGDVVDCGQVLYRAANEPVVLLCGDVPAYRSLSEGDTGPDVTELKRNLVRLGYATRSQLDLSSNYFGANTAYALEKLQDKLGEDETGSLDLGQAVFLPGPLRITSTSAALGTMARPGMPVMQATSIARQVQVALDASEQSSVKVGANVLVTLPDNQTTPGTVTRIGTVASGSGSSGSGSSGSNSSTATIPIYVTLKHPSDARGLDQAPVQVQITTAGVHHALIVPIDALLALSGSRYAVETVDAHGVHHPVPVAVGEFDDADGLVQVSSSSLSAGEHVVVPSI